jgi:hypothetical protein
VRSSKGREQLRELFDSVLTGYTTRNAPSDEHKFSQQAAIVERDILGVNKGNENLVPGKFIIHPETFVARWESSEKLSEIIWESKLGSRRFPQEYPNPRPHKWGISGSYNDWALTREGLFYYWRAYFENALP